MYDTAEYARSRLADTIIMYNGDPVLVHTVSRGNDRQLIVVGTVVETGRSVEAKLSDCDIRPVPLGYVNYNRKAFYTMRMPMRRDWKQGLRYVNLIDTEGRQFNGIGYEVFVNTIKNKYPTFQAAVEALKQCNSMAFHRDFCVMKNGDVMYKGLIKVATFDKDSSSFSIGKEWIREALDEAVGV